MRATWAAAISSPRRPFAPSRRGWQRGPAQSTAMLPGPRATPAARRASPPRADRPHRTAAHNPPRPPRRRPAPRRRSRRSPWRPPRRCGARSRRESGPDRHDQLRAAAPGDRRMRRQIADVRRLDVSRGKDGDHALDGQRRLGVDRRACVGGRAGRGRAEETGVGLARQRCGGPGGGRCRAADSRPRGVELAWRVAVRLRCPCRIGLKYGGRLEIPTGTRSCNDPSINCGRADEIGLGLAGLGTPMAGAVMVHAAAAHPDFVLRARPRPPSPGTARGLRPRPQRAAYADVKMLGRRSGSHTPRRNTRSISRKADGSDACGLRRISRRSSAMKVVGHTHAFDPAVRCARDHCARRARQARAHSQLQLHQLSLPPAARQAGARAGRRHPVQTGAGAASDRHARLLAGRPRAPCARARPLLDPARAATETRGSFSKRLRISLIPYSDEWHFGISERGAPKPLAHGAPPRLVQEGRGGAPFLWRGGPTRTAAAPAAFRRHHRHLRRR